MLSHLARETVASVFREISPSLTFLYDVAHSIGKMEEHVVDGRLVKVLVHRKGAIRAFGSGARHPRGVPRVGQLVLVPGDMGRDSYLPAGTTDEMELAFASACHGAGRAMSRSAAKKSLSAEALSRQLSREGILVRSATVAGLVEEAPSAHKDVENTVAATADAVFALKVARLRPMGAIKG